MIQSYFKIKKHLHSYPLLFRTGLLPGKNHLEVTTFIQAEGFSYTPASVKRCRFQTIDEGFIIRRGC